MTESHTCPNCGGEVMASYTCHTWPQTYENGRVVWMACLGCDSAIEYYCNEDTDCIWQYIDGLNPKNPRAAKNEESKPSWL